MATGSDRPDADDEPLQKSGRSGFSEFTGRAAVVLGMLTLVVILFFLFWQLLSLLLVLFLGVLMAILLRGMANRLADHSPLTPHWALAVVTVVLVAVIGLVGWLMAPAVAEQGRRLAETIPEAWTELGEWLETTTLGQPLIDELADLDVDQFMQGEILGPLGGAVFGVVGFFSHLLFVVAIAIYLAYDPEVYKRGIVRLVPLHYRERAEEILDVSTHQLAWWLIGRLLAMLGVAVIITVGLAILGVPLPIFLGLIAGLLSFVPILGPIVSAIPAGLVAFTISPQYVVWVVLVFVGAQMIESYLITPIVQQRVVSLPHAMTLIAEVFAGILFGVVGITVATPLAVLLMALINMIYIEDVLGDTTPFTELADKYH